MIEKTVVRHQGTSDKYPRYRIVREYYWVNDEIIVGDDELADMELLDEVYWTGDSENQWSDNIGKAILYTKLAEAVEDRNNIVNL